MTTFRARKYDPGQAAPQSVTLEVAAGALLVNGAELRVSLDDLDLQVGGHSNDRIKLSSRSSGITFMCEDPALLEALKAQGMHCAVGAAAATAHKKIKGLRAAQMRYWAIVLVSVAAVLVGLYLSVDLAVDMAAATIDPALEVKLSEFVLDKEKLDKQPTMAARVKNIGSKLVSHLSATPYKFNFYVKDLDEVNAGAYPGGFIVVNSGLVERAKSDDELAGVLGHEIGHVVNRDTLRGLLHNAGVFACIGLVAGASGQSADKVATALSIAHKLEDLHYSRHQEGRADQTGVRLSFASGYDPEALVGFFQRLEQEDPTGDNKLFAMISTHPMHSERITAIRAEIARLKRQRAETPGGKS